MMPDKYQEMALKTWYAPDHELHRNPRHPLIKLAGEAGELLDLYGKDQYKPGFSWWECKRCGFLPEDKKRSEVDRFALTCFNNGKHTPLVLDELGDWFYYLRILAYQQGVTLKPGEAWTEDILYLLVSLSSYSTGLLEGWVHDEAIAKNYILVCYDILLGLLAKLDCTIEDLAALNYRKLNSEPTAHGWKS